MQKTYYALCGWYRRYLLSYRPIYDNGHVQKILQEIHKNLKSYLESADDERRYIAASRAHYIAQSWQRPLYSRLLLELISFSLIMPLIGYWWGKSIKANINKQSTSGMRLVHKQLDYYYIPKELKESCVETLVPKQRYLRGKDIVLLFKSAWLTLSFISPAPYKWHISGLVQHWLKLASETARLRPVFDSYTAPYFIVYAEYDCSISFQTLLCHREGVYLYDVIHGDHLYGMADPFFQVDRCYCWHNFYVEQFKNQYCKADFRMFENPNFSITQEEKNRPGQGIGVVMPHPVYSESKKVFSEELKLLAEQLNQIAEQQTVTLRPHPSYPEYYQKIRPYLSDKIRLSDPQIEPARVFLIRHKIIIGTFSALLIEAAMVGKEVKILRNKIIAQIAKYHFLFKKENVFFVSLSNLDIK